MIDGTLAHFRVTAKLGEGGMGEVWRATDSRLRREVAIKVLPEAFATDAERLTRFEREAQALAQLQHPNVASIYGLEEGDGRQALVMELVEGPTLAERLARGRLDLEEILAIARQIAEALEAAHEKGIVHRDLKPQNVKITPEGQVKVLDFGLAKALEPAGTASRADSASRLAASPTLTLGATVQGMILGTAAYMAPEQAKGVAVDKRADI
ncbi:MAG TPA: serine/threonine-protein kinase, partial [Thermoanaerobaculia bacterium]|nr:serine/threonine-protein kinase [Thermoanaerobaculia bacterium]